ncbi:hypothetical protein ABZ671_07415 [Micromonospora sp. NPDC006766]|uniref:hypothetical protein n=1 Tax=Micromonospora sp. NPDC006766 TaxID=3154778 RepID=UPI0034019C3A
MHLRRPLRVPPDPRRPRGRKPWAVVNALVAGRDMTGRDGHRVPGLPHARVAELLRAAAE